MHCRLFFCALCVIIWASPLRAATTYVATLLGTSDYTNSIAYAASNSVQAGYATAPFGTHAFVWHSDAASTIDLNPNGYSGSNAYAAFGSRQAGFAATADSTKYAFVWNGSATSADEFQPLLGDDLSNPRDDGYEHGGFWNAFRWRD